MNELRDIEQRLETVAAQIQVLQSMVGDLLSNQRPDWQAQAPSGWSAYRRVQGPSGYGSRYAAIQRDQDERDHEGAGPNNDTAQCTGRNHALAEFRRPL